jgi:hypothetical protein
MGFLNIFKSNKKKNISEFDKYTFSLALQIFPDGYKQIEEESEKLHVFFKDILTIDETKKLLIQTKLSIHSSKRVTESEFVDSIILRSGGKLELNNAKLFYKKVACIPDNVYAGGDGSSQENAIIINAKLTKFGIGAEYDWIETHYGKRDKDWKTTLIVHNTSNDRTYESFDIILPDGSVKILYFDITSFYLKF